MGCLKSVISVRVNAVLLIDGIEGSAFELACVCV